MQFQNVKVESKESRVYGLDRDILTFGPVDYLTRVPDYVTGVANYIPYADKMDERTTRFVSGYLNSSYSYLDRYTLSASLRRDASNLFGVTTNNKWNLLWSVGSSWELSKERFFKVADIPYLRIRATYGLSGNIDPAMSALTTIRYVGISNNTIGAPYARPLNYANPALKWETVSTFNLGADFRYRDFLTGTIDYYVKRGSDLFGTQTLDPTLGIGTSILRNVATMRSYGVDLSLSTQNISKENFRWATTLHFNHNKDEVLEYFISNIVPNALVSGNTISAIKGRPVYALRSYAWAGLDPTNGDPQGYLDGVVSKDYRNIMGVASPMESLIYHGPSLPSYFGSLSNSFVLGAFSLDVNLSYKLGHYFRRDAIGYYPLLNSGSGHLEYADRWQSPGDEAHTDVPSLVYPYNDTQRDAFYRSASVTAERAGHIRLNYVNVSYAFKRIHRSVDRADVFINARNLGLIWRANNRGIDPEVAGRYSPYPSMVLTAGIRLNLKPL